MAERITHDTLVSEGLARRVLAALQLKGLSRRQWAEQEGLVYEDLSRVLNRKQVPSQRFAEKLNALIDELPGLVNSDAR